MRFFAGFFNIQIIPLNNCISIIMIVIGVIKKIRIYIINIVIFFVSLKYINMVGVVCCNLKVTNIANYTFNQNQNFIKNTNHYFPTLAQ